MINPNSDFAQKHLNKTNTSKTNQIMLIKFRNKFIILLTIFTCCISQMRAEGNLPYVDYKPYHFGFSLGLNAFDFGVQPSLQSIDGKVYQVDVSNLMPGFSVGIIGDARINDFWNTRFTPTLQFGERTLNYSADSGVTNFQKNITSITICLPLYLKYSAERIDNFRPYLIGGGGINFDLGRDKSNPVLLKPLDVYTEFGVGCDIYFSFFKLSPELKLAVGFNDMLTPITERDNDNISAEDKKYLLALSKLTSRMFTLTFNFE